jgi:hypothetical protein
MSLYIQINLSCVIPLTIYESHYEVVYHHGVARLQLADVGDGLQIWKVAENIYRICSRVKATRGGPPVSASGEGQIIPHCKSHTKPRNRLTVLNTVMNLLVP